MTRVILLPSAYAPALGGVEELTARLAHRLQLAGDDVEVWTILHPANLPAQETVGGVTIRRFAMPLPRLAPGALARLPRAVRVARRSLLTAARAFDPEILHVQCFSANGVYATWLARRLRIPLVITLQGETVMDDSNVYDRSLTLRYALRHALRRADAVTACSRYVVADAEERFGLEPSRGRVIPNGVELNEDAPPESFELPFSRFVFAVGRVVEKKGFDLLLAAYARIAAEHPDVGLVIGGEGLAKDPLRRLAEDQGLGDLVVFPGRLSRGQIAWAMAAAEIFVLPSRIEPFGIVILEALRAGCPAIVSIHGGGAEIVRDGIEGILVDPLDCSSLAAALERLLSDRALARVLGEAGPSRAKAFDWALVAQRYRDVYGTAGRHDH